MSEPGSERRRIGQEIVLRVRTTPTGVKVLEFDGTGLREGVMSKRNRRYCYGDDAEGKATEYAYRKKEELEEQRDCPVIVVELGEVMHEKLAKFDQEPGLATDGGEPEPLNLEMLNGAVLTYETADGETVTVEFSGDVDD